MSWEKPDLLKLMWFVKRHEQLTKLRYRSGLENIEIDIIGKFIQGVEKTQSKGLRKGLLRLDAELKERGIQIIDKHVEYVH